MPSIGPCASAVYRAQGQYKATVAEHTMKRTEGMDLRQFVLRCFVFSDIAIETIITSTQSNLVNTIKQKHFIYLRMYLS